MKIIEILEKVSNGEIEKGTKFILGDNLFIFNGDRFKAGNFYLGSRIFLNARDLNREVELIEPEPKKYYLKLRNNDLDFTNYVNRFKDCFGTFCYTIFDKAELDEYQTKFTQGEIESDRFLRFVEKHGVKEEVEDDETDSRY